MLSNHGLKVLAKMYSSFRNGYIRENKWCNENEVEREFLDHCKFSFDETPFSSLSQEDTKEIDRMIAEIQ